MVRPAEPERTERAEVQASERAAEIESYYRSLAGRSVGSFALIRAAAQSICCSRLCCERDELGMLRLGLTTHVTDDEYIRAIYLSIVRCCQSLARRDTDTDTDTDQRRRHNDRAKV